MSENATEDPPVMTYDEVAAEVRPDQVMELLQEYQKKLIDSIKSANEFQVLAKSHRGADVDAQNAARNQLIVLKKWFIKIRPPATDLARHASTMIEGVKLKRLTNLELRLRLAEFEAALERANDVLPRVNV